jgi:hypothetical protein
MTQMDKASIKQELHFLLAEGKLLVLPFQLP